MKNTIQSSLSDTSISHVKSSVETTIEVKAVQPVTSGSHENNQPIIINSVENIQPTEPAKVRSLEVPQIAKGLSQKAEKVSKASTTRPAFAEQENQSTQTTPDIEASVQETKQSAERIPDIKEDVEIPSNSPTMIEALSEIKKEIKHSNQVAKLVSKVAAVKKELERAQENSGDMKSALSYYRQINRDLMEENSNGCLSQNQTTRAIQSELKKAEAARGTLFETIMTQAHIIQQQAVEIGELKVIRKECKGVIALKDIELCSFKKGVKELLTEKECLEFNNRRLRKEVTLLRREEDEKCETHEPLFDDKLAQHFAGWSHPFFQKFRDARLSRSAFTAIPMPITAMSAPIQVFSVRIDDPAEILQQVQAQQDNGGDLPLSKTQKKKVMNSLFETVSNFLPKAGGENVLMMFLAMVQHNLLPNDTNVLTLELLNAITRDVMENSQPVEYDPKSWLFPAEPKPKSVLKYCGALAAYPNVKPLLKQICTEFNKTNPPARVVLSNQSQDSPEVEAENISPTETKQNKHVPESEDNFGEEKSQEHEVQSEQRQPTQHRTVRLLSWLSIVLAAVLFSPIFMSLANNTFAHFGEKGLYNAWTHLPRNQGLTIFDSACPAPTMRGPELSNGGEFDTTWGIVEDEVNLMVTEEEILEDSSAGDGTASSENTNSTSPKHALRFTDLIFPTRALTSDTIFVSFLRLTIILGGFYMEVAKGA